MICVDDLNDWSGYWGVIQMRNPYMDRVGSKGGADYQCAMSSSYLWPLPGLYDVWSTPSTTGIMAKLTWRKSRVSSDETLERSFLPRIFQKQWYHHKWKDQLFTTSHLQVFSIERRREKKIWAKRKKTLNADKREPVRCGAFLKRSIQMPDYRTQNGPWKLGKIYENISSSALRPHVPWYCTTKWLICHPVSGGVPKPLL